MGQRIFAALPMHSSLRNGTNMHRRPARVAEDKGILIGEIELQDFSLKFDAELSEIILEINDLRQLGP